MHACMHACLHDILSAGCSCVSEHHYSIRKLVPHLGLQSRVKAVFLTCRMQMKMGMAGGGRHGGGGASPFGGPAGPFSAGGGSMGGFEFTFVGGGNPFMHMGGGGPSMYGSSRCHSSCSTAQTIVKTHTSRALKLRSARYTAKQFLSFQSTE